MIRRCLNGQNGSGLIWQPGRVAWLTDTRAVFGEKGPVITLALVLVALVMTGASWAAPASESGTRKTGQVCVAKLPKNAAKMDRDPVREEKRRDYTYNFSVRIGKRDWVKVPGEKGVLIRDISTGRRHTVIIRDGDRVIESFAFTFEEKGAARLCLSYTPWYQTWRLEAPPPKAWWCKCEAPAGSRGPS